MPCKYMACLTAAHLLAKCAILLQSCNALLVVLLLLCQLCLKAVDLQLKPVSIGCRQVYCAEHALSSVGILRAMAGCHFALARPCTDISR